MIHTLDYCKIICFYVTVLSEVIFVVNFEVKQCLTYVYYPLKVMEAHESHFCSGSDVNHMMLCTNTMLDYYSQTDK